MQLTQEDCPSIAVGRQGNNTEESAMCYTWAQEWLCTWLAIVVIPSSHMEAAHLACIAGEHVLQAALSQQLLKLCTGAHWSSFSLR